MKNKEAFLIVQRNQKKSLQHHINDKKKSEEKSATSYKDKKKSEEKFTTLYKR